MPVSSSAYKCPLVKVTESFQLTINFSEYFSREYSKSVPADRRGSSSLVDKKMVLSEPRKSSDRLEPRSRLMKDMNTRRLSSFLCVLGSLCNLYTQKHSQIIEVCV